MGQWERIIWRMRKGRFAEQPSLSKEACVVAHAAQNSVIGQLEGATIVASDGQFLGIISENAFNSKSIANEYGDYGSQYSSTSIFNEFGNCGGGFSDKSPFYDFKNDPPQIMLR